MSERPQRRGGGWEAGTLRVLAVPANLVLGGIVAFLLAIPVVTLLPVLIALGRSMARWRTEEDDAVVTNLLRELRVTWRRTWAWGLLFGLVVVVLVLNSLFLAAQFGQEGSQPAVLLAGATVPVALVVLLLGLLVPVASALEPQASMREWSRVAVELVMRAPLRALLVLILAVAVVGACVVLWTLGPFLVLSLPIYLAVLTFIAKPGPADAA
ncbi:DUF624 domain-containing protein [Serinibacter salmoneus]|uniref:Uncharacterized protein DUF624 n=1 Tax=Serinibacter salmoneus TaxID=556530 RepID=A0A2A9CZP2_9MICO|nr:DUF624 domain-containing protein [Serinibacter salmoneus]PFG19596.1 uncharacterized protein DUF624 [Serinibacter salmoneus]